jgi:hypothetical protein
MDANAVKFINDYVRITDVGVDLIGTHPFKHIPFSDIKDIRIENGYLVKNRLPIRIVGSVIIITAVYFIVRLMKPLTRLPDHRYSAFSHVRLWMLPVFIPK